MQNYRNKKGKQRKKLHFTYQNAFRYVRLSSKAHFNQEPQAAYMHGRTHSEPQNADLIYYW